MFNTTHSSILRALPTWLPGYLRHTPAPATSATCDILFCICDHYEPFHATDKAGAQRRLDHWRKLYPVLAAEFKDADGCRPRHTFFYPAEQYDAEIMTKLAELQQADCGEVEIHLHHADDTAQSLRRKLTDAKQQFTAHGLLSRDASGATRYGFIHGNWALDNSDPRGINCGVNTELDELQATGCYADFTMPSAPHPAQTRMVNSLYYAADTPTPKSHDRGIPAHVLKGADTNQTDQPPGLLLVQGPLALNWQSRKYGILPRIENGELAGNNPPNPERMRIWLAQGIHVIGKPDWIFIKLHTHGCDEQRGTPDMLLGEPMRRFHRHLAKQYKDGGQYRLHYVTAREMVNILHAAEDGNSGNPGNYRDYQYKVIFTGGA